MPYPVYWTYDDIIEMRRGAIELLRLIERHANLRSFCADWWKHWVEVKGMPVPEDWDDIKDYDDYVEEYRETLFRGVKWHAFHGSRALSDSDARMNRIQQLIESIDHDLLNLRRAGIDLHSPVSDSYTTTLDASHH